MKSAGAGRSGAGRCGRSGSMTAPCRPQRALVLPVVLVLIALLALIVATYMFMVRATLSGEQAQQNVYQARLAAESGLQEVLFLVRRAPNDMAVWWDNPTLFHHRLVWAPTFDRENDPVPKLGSRRELLEAGRPPEAWRYSVVGTYPDGVLEAIRFGITPEAGKLNLNAASEAEIERLLTDVLQDLALDNVSDLIAALLDWLDEDDETRPGGAEADYYASLDPGYRPKNGKLDSLEELLLIKGWSAVPLYGEDLNRNGLLDPNEDDGAASFPRYDNADGVLQRGLYPYITLWSREPRPPGQGGAGGGGQGDPYLWGKVNVNTAPLRVLQALEGMPPEAAQQIVARRAELTPEELSSPQWLLGSGILDPAALAVLQERMTTRALQFRIEILGYGDHTKLMRRYEWIVEMRGSTAQVLYHRDLTNLGQAWPIDEEKYIPRREQ